MGKNEITRPKISKELWIEIKLRSIRLNKDMVTTSKIIAEQLKTGSVDFSERITPKKNDRKRII